MSCLRAHTKPGLICIVNAWRILQNGWISCIFDKSFKIMKPFCNMLRTDHQPLFPKSPWGPQWNFWMSSHEGVVPVFAWSLIFETGWPAISFDYLLKTSRSACLLRPYPILDISINQSASPFSSSTESVVLGPLRQSKVVLSLALLYNYGRSWNIKHRWSLNVAHWFRFDGINCTLQSCFVILCTKLTTHSKIIKQDSLNFKMYHLK